jgi:hypothetical protein
MRVISLIVILKDFTDIRVISLIIWKIIIILKFVLLHNSDFQN